MAVGIHRRGNRVLAIDTDPQGSLTAVMGYSPHDIPAEKTISGMIAEYDDKGECSYDCILKTEEGVDLIPANATLSTVQVGMIDMMSRESCLSQIIDGIKDNYDFILIDGQPSLNIMTINALVASTDVIIPMQPATLSAYGLQDILSTIRKVQKPKLNPDLRIAGVVFTMVNPRTLQYTKIRREIEAAFGPSIHIFDTRLPYTIKSDEANYDGVSLYKHVPHHKLTLAYDALITEVLKCLS